MTYDEIIKSVQDRAGLETREAAEDAARVVIQALADRLTGDEADDLVAQLPSGYVELLLAEPARR